MVHWLSGFVPQTFRYPFEGEITFRNQASARQTFYDRLVDRYVPDGGQLVILGAGFDTRAFRIPCSRRVRSFEVDLPKTQAIKREVLRRADIERADVSLVSTDFEHDDWLASLIGAGFDRRAPALFLWEGVTPYLSRAAVDATLRKVASTSKGSVVGFDYFTTEVLKSKSPALRMLRASLNASGEPLKFGVDGTPPLRDGVARWLQECGLSLADHRVVGNESGSGRAWEGFAIAIVQ